MTPAATTEKEALPPEISASKPKVWQRPWFRIAGSAIILILLFTILPAKQIVAAVKRIPPVLGLGLLCGYLGLHLLGVVKWRILINSAGADLGLFAATRCYYGGLFGNVFLPSLVGGDVVRAGMAFSHSRSKSAIVLGSLMDRVQDVLGLATITAIGVLLLPGTLDYRTHKLFWMLTGVLVLGGAACLGLVIAVPARKLPFKARRLMAKLRRGVRSMYRRPAKMILAFLLGMGLQVSQVAINFWLGEATGLHISPKLWLFAWPLAKISALLPVTQGGIGVRDAALISLLAPFGIAPASAAAVSLTFQAIVLTGGLIAGFIAFVLGRHARK
ncbi:MAG TPA: lysylphosphatidylglycerol synthase transmembrane domain-containing protein [Bryobacteraceae bacterium]